MLGKRRFRYATKGSDVPVIASTLKKKKSQRGPTVGRVLMNRKIRPPQPIMAKIIAIGRNDLTGGDVSESISELILSHASPSATEWDTNGGYP